jgi:4-hydroxybenzoate polyprenyltransferase
MIAYWIERFSPRVFGPAAAFIALAGQEFAPFDPRQWANATLTTILLLAQFRLWDDLADRDRDRAAHPERVLVRTHAAIPFVAAGLVLAVLNLVLAGSSGRGIDGVLACVLLNAAAAAWYAWRPARRTVATDLVLLLKYPWYVIVVAGSGVSTPQIAFGALATYIAACAYEFWHDAAGPLRFNNS